MTNNNDRIKAIVATLVTHGLLLLLLAFLTLSVVTPDPIDEGVMVQMEEAEQEEPEEEKPELMAADQGNTDEASSQDEDEGGQPAVSQAPKQAPVNAAPDRSNSQKQEAKSPKQAETPKPATATVPKKEDKVIAQANEQSRIEAQRAAEKAKKEAEAETARQAAAAKKAEEERKAAEKRKAEAEAARQAEEARLAKEKADREARESAANRLNGKFGSGSGTTANGGNGAGSGSGTGQGGVGGTASVGNRKVTNLPKPAYTDNTTSGTIVVGITVDAAGHVTSTAIKSNTTNSAKLRDAALAAAKQARFSTGTQVESGTITYNFRLQ